MSAIRAVQMSITARPVLEGAGVHLNRVFGFGNEELFDPFLLLDDFRSDTPEHYLKGFPWHPHRGIETITYVLAGDVEHGDSLGNRGTISSGDVQWMTAGSGIIHQEMPKGDANGSMHGFQLWANLPAKDKMIDPRYRDITSAQIPEITRGDGTKIKIIAGSLDGVRGPVTDIATEPEYFDVTLAPNSTFSHATPSDHTAMLYTIGGGKSSASRVDNGTLLLFGRGDEMVVSSGPDGLRFLLLCGRPLREPIAWRGPIVMNSEEELETAFREYQQGTFIKHR